MIGSIFYFTMNQRLIASDLEIFSMGMIVLFFICATIWYDLYVRLKILD